jgi:hypothetical protein
MIPGPIQVVQHAWFGRWLGIRQAQKSSFSIFPDARQWIDNVYLYKPAEAVGFIRELLGGSGSILLRRASLHLNRLGSSWMT